MQLSWRQTILIKAAMVVSTFLIAWFFVFGGTIVLAQSEELGDTADAAGLQNADLFEVIGTVINVFLGTLGIIFLLIVIYAGFLWMTAGGNAEQVEKAKKLLVNAVIGLVIILGSYAITRFVMNALQNSGLGGNGGSGGGDGISVELLSGSLGSGAIRDHYPERFATDVARNTKIFVTFKDAMDVASFIEGYNGNAAAVNLNTDNVLVYQTSDGSKEALPSEEVTVAFTEDLKTFVIDPPVLGSSSTDTNYTVFLSDAILNAEGEKVLNAGGYRWTFTVGTELDVTPPTVDAVIPRANGTYDRNIVVQIDFSEAIDPTSATGSTIDGFENIQVAGVSLVDGEYVISNGYRTITFISSEACGTNSCGETMYCLPGNQSIATTIFAPTPGVNPPQVDEFPYRGIVDVASNALDGNDDGVAGDDFAWGFDTTNAVNFSRPEILNITPDIHGSDVDLDQDVVVTFGCPTGVSTETCNSVMMSSSLTPDSLALSPVPTHELWYSLSKKELGESGEPVGADEEPTRTQVTVKHGVFLESTDVSTYSYRVGVNDQVKNQYQNCFIPAAGPALGDARCIGAPFCCNGEASETACSEL